MSDSLDRYILWAMEHYRQGDYPSDYAHETKPKKQIRGCGFFPLDPGWSLRQNVEQPRARRAIRQADPVSATQISL